MPGPWEIRLNDVWHLRLQAGQAVSIVCLWKVSRFKTWDLGLRSPFGLLRGTTAFSVSPVFITVPTLWVFHSGTPTWKYNGNFLYKESICMVCVSCCSLEPGLCHVGNKAVGVLRPDEVMWKDLGKYLGSDNFYVEFCASSSSQWIPAESLS